MMKTSQHDAAPVRGRNVVVCCDGTGMEEDRVTGQAVTPSNVKKIFMCIDTDARLKMTDEEWKGYDVNKKNGEEGPLEDLPRHQIAYYERGVASMGGALAKATSGMTGFGIGTKIIIMYAWLGTHWHEYDAKSGEEDRLYLFGFSRGAFAVRSLMGMIYNVGLLDLRGLPYEEAYRRAEIAFERGYAKRLDKSRWAKGSGKKFRERDPQPWKFFGDERGRIPVHFVGVWDTVGQLGLPRETWCLWMLGLCCAFTPNKYAFHDVRLNPTVRTGRHAVAIDEMRSTFQPVFDRKMVGNTKMTDVDMKQVWFPGCHGNVGGGLVDTGLSDGALKWMVDAAAEKGLRFHKNLVDQIKPNPRGPIFYTHGLSVYKNLTHYPRSPPPIVPENVEDVNPDKVDLIHSSAVERSQNPPIADAPYYPHEELAVGQSTIVTIRADKIYNPTNVYLHPNTRWKFTAEGRWSGFRDRHCGPEGYPDSVFGRPPAVSLAVGIGRCQRGFRRLTGNPEANLPFTRRHDFYPWYSLMGMVATGGTRDSTAKAELHRIVGIGKGTEYAVGEKGGYLFCYCNDSWGKYLKNKGSVEMRIERLGNNKEGGGGEVL